MELNYYRAGAGEPLLLIHGIGSRWQVWEPVLDPITREREVIAIDLPGFGASPPPPPGTPPGFASLTRLVVEFLEEMGWQRPHAAGNSLGGWLVLELAKQGQARSATALSPAGFQRGPEAIYQRASLRTSVQIARLLAPRAHRIVQSVTGRRLLLSQMVAHPERVSPADAADSIRALAEAPWFDETFPAINSETFADGEEITVPVTVAWGQRDRLLLPRQSARVSRLIPRAKVMTLLGCGHVPTYDDPEQVAAVLLEGSGG